MSELERLYKLRPRILKELKNNLDKEEKRGCMSGINHFHQLDGLDDEISKLEALKMARPIIEGEL